MGTPRYCLVIHGELLAYRNLRRECLDSQATTVRAEEYRQTRRGACRLQREIIAPAYPETLYRT